MILYRWAEGLLDEDREGAEVKGGKRVVCLPKTRVDQYVGQAPVSGKGHSELTDRVVLDSTGKQADENQIR